MRGRAVGSSSSDGRQRVMVKCSQCRGISAFLREMPDASEMRRTDGFGAGRDIKYEEVKNFQQCDAWNAYIVAVSV